MSATENSNDSSDDFSISKRRRTTSPDLSEVGSISSSLFI